MTIIVLVSTIPLGPVSILCCDVLDESPYDFRAVMLYRPRLNFGEVLVERCEQIVHAGLVEVSVVTFVVG